MRLYLRWLFTCLFASSLLAVEQVDPSDPKQLPEKKAGIEVAPNPVAVVEKKSASQLYRSWVNPVQAVQRPSSQAQGVEMIRPEVQKPQLEQTFSQMQQWKPGTVLRVYEKSKDFGKVLNPLSLRDFNRFIYQRNPSSP